MSKNLKREIRLAHRTYTAAPIFNEVPAQAELLAALEKVSKTFEAFKAQNDKDLAEIRKGREDVVTKEHVDRINAELGKSTTALEDIQKKLAAAAIGGGEGSPSKTPEARAHRNAFNKYVRKGGNEAELGGLQVQAALSTDSNPDGGFFVPEETDAVITRALTTVSAMRRLADVVPVNSPNYKAIHNLGGATTGWVGEQQARTETSTPRLSELNFPFGEIYAQPAATQQMLDTSIINVDAWLAGEVNITFAEQEGAAFISGNGVNKPKGFLDYNKVANANYAWGSIGFVVSGASGAFVASSSSANAYDSLIELYHGLKSGYRNGAAWLGSDATLANIRKVKDAQGNYIYTPPNETEPGSILGKPIEIDDNMPAMAANSYSLAFANWKQAYKILDLSGVRVLRDPYSSKPYVLFYTTKRVGGGIRDYAAIKLMKFST